MDFKDKVAAVNETLVGYGGPAITSHTKGKGANEKTYTGYKIQYVVDAVNEVIGAENWRWEASGVEAARNPSGQSSTANVAVTLCIRVGDEWIAKGSVTGDSLNPVETDAMKGALSDGLKKSFAYWSIGNKAYRGELDANNKKKPSKSAKATSAPKPNVTQGPPAKDGPPADIYTDILTKIEDATKTSDLRGIPNLISVAGLSDDEQANLKQYYNDKQAKLKK